MKSAEYMARDSASRIALKYLQILKKAEKNYNPFRWVRYVTTSNSYTFRT